MRTYTAVIERDPETGVFVVVGPVDLSEVIPLLP